MNTPFPIAVVGAGISGLACARALHSAGWPVTLFDKSRGPGGRMSTRRGEGWQCDHGARHFTAESARFRAEVEHWQAAGVAARWQPRILGDDPDASRPRFVGTPRMTSPARHLADGLDLRLAFTLRHLAHDADGWQLSSLEHGPLPARFAGLILAVPAPQAVPLLAEVAPAEAGLARQVAMAPCWTLMLRYEHALKLPFDVARPAAGPLAWVAREASKPGRPEAGTWLLQATPEWSAAHLEDAPDDVAAALVAAFRALGAPAPAAWSAHRWRYADTRSATAGACIWSAERRLGLCGDWLNGGGVEGAWLSGMALADAILGRKAGA
jgi:predicted NAD/FAD-dependent oxidoreductase